jgi:hypothetical protein
MSWPQGRRIKSLKNPKEPTENRTRDLPAYSAVARPTAPSRAPFKYQWKALILLYVSLTRYVQSNYVFKLPSPYNQSILSTKCNSWHILIHMTYINSYMFRHRCAIFRELLKQRCTIQAVWPTKVQSQAGWLVHPWRNKSLWMARRCRNMLEFMYVTCILSRITFVE